MKIYKINEQELDEKLELDKRSNQRGFRTVFNSLEEAPDGFYDLQNQIRNGLQQVFWLAFDKGVEDLPDKPWDSKYFYFNTDIFGSESLVVEMSKEILGDKLIGLIMSYLEKCSSRYCLIASVYESMERGAVYLGRFVINLDEIAVEEALVDTWFKQVRVMEIEN